MPNICQQLTRSRNQTILNRLLIEPTVRTGREHGLMLCRSPHGRITAHLIRGTRRGIPAHACGWYTDPLVFLHTHPAPHVSIVMVAWHGEAYWAGLSDVDRDHADREGTATCALAITPRMTRRVSYRRIITECYTPADGRTCRAEWRWVESQTL